jgi:hypothetical protein
LIRLRGPRDFFGRRFCLTGFSRLLWLAPRAVFA